VCANKSNQIKSTQRNATDGSEEMMWLWLLCFLVCQQDWWAVTGKQQSRRRMTSDENFPNVAFEHPRFPANATTARKTIPLLAFLSITSGPHHAHLRSAIRQSWILPCRQSARCDYRFFIDTVSSSSSSSANNTASGSSSSSSNIASTVLEELLLENSTFGDLVFRDQCALMRRHPLSINYGNSPPVSGNLKIETEDETSFPNPDYPLRRMYKIDWKVCFLKIIHRLLYDLDNVFAHVFVEDDRCVFV
jgi:hypothetical protein